MVELDERRQRVALEVVTAILLGLVAVATAAGAYQASLWSQQANVYTSAAGQLRDESLASGIASQIASFDDNERMADALAIELEIMADGDDTGELRDEQTRLLLGGSPGLSQEWDEWVASGYADAEYPGSGAEYVAAQLAPTYGANRASAVAYGLADEIGSKSLQVTVSSAIFALALLLLGVSGANRSFRVALGLAIGGAATFLIGVAISIFAVVG